MTSDIGREFEFPKTYRLSIYKTNFATGALTPIAVTKFAGRFPNPNALETPFETRYDINVCTTKITGMTANSKSLSAVNCEANLVKTADD